MQKPVWHLQREIAACVAKHIGYKPPLCRFRFDFQRMADQLLADGVERLQVGDVLRHIDAGLVVVAGFMDDTQPHRVPRLWLVVPEWVK